MITIDHTKDDLGEVYQTGTFIHIQEAMPIKDSLRLLVQGVRRISLDSANHERNIRSKEHAEGEMWK